MQATLYSTTLLMNPFQTLSTLYWTASQHPCHNGHTHWRQRADWLQAGSPCLQGSVGQTPKLDVVCVPPRHRHWLSAVRSCQPSVTELFRSPPLISGTVFHSSHVSTVTGHLSQSPQDSSLQALLSMTSPFSCRAREVTCHYGHVNHFYYLLTYSYNNARHFWWYKADTKRVCSCLFHYYYVNSEDSWKRFCLSRTMLRRLVTLAFRCRIQILLLTYLLTYLQSGLLNSNKGDLRWLTNQRFIIINKLQI